MFDADPRRLQISDAVIEAPSRDMDEFEMNKPTTRQRIASPIPQRRSHISRSSSLQAATDNRAATLPTNASSQHSRVTIRPSVINVSQSIRTEDVDDDEISVQDPLENRRPSRVTHLTSVPLERDFPGFSVERHSSASHRDHVQRQADIEQRHASDGKFFLQRSATDEPQIWDTDRFELTPKKRQTVHSYMPTGTLEGRAMQRQGRSSTVRPRPSKFQPYNPTDWKGIGLQSGASAKAGSTDMSDLHLPPFRKQSFLRNPENQPAEKQRTFNNAKYEDGQRITHSQPNLARLSSRLEFVSFEDELRDKLQQRRARIEQQQTFL